MTRRLAELIAYHFLRNGMAPGAYEELRQVLTDAADEHEQLARDVRTLQERLAFAGEPVDSHRRPRRRG